MSRREFQKCLKRRGFSQVLLWVRDATGEVPNISWGFILHPNGKPAYRATLAMVIRERDREIAARDQKGVAA
jgi:hypothetical protein